MHLNPKTAEPHSAFYVCISILSKITCELCVCTYIYSQCHLYFHNFMSTTKQIKLVMNGKWWKRL